MKRKGDPLEDTRLNKQRCQDTVLEYFQDSKNELSCDAIQKSLSEDGKQSDGWLGWLAATVKMSWRIPKPKNLRFMLSLSDGEQLEVTFSKSSVPDLKLDTLDKIKLSLESATTEPLTGSSVSSRLPFKIHYADGAALMYISKRSLPELNGIVMCTLRRLDDWYGTPFRGCDELNVRNQRMSSTTSSPRGSELAPSPIDTPAPVTPPSELPSQVTEVHPEPVVDGVFLLGHDSTLIHQSNFRSSEEICKQQPQKIVEETNDTESAATKNEQPVVSRQLSAQLQPEKEKRKRNKKARHDAGKKHNNKNTPLSGPVEPPRNPALDMKAGLVGYPPLNTIRTNIYTPVIGVLSASSTSGKTKYGGFYITLNLFDPSNVHEGSFLVTCFHPEENGLPPWNEGQIILLRSVKTEVWRSKVNGKVYPNRLEWAEFDPASGRYHHGEQPKKAVSDVERRQQFYNPNSQEIDYFVKLGQWWRAFKDDAANKDSVIWNASPSISLREHRLIGETEANVFFDATVEIIQNVPYDELQQTYLILSDYSAHPQISSSGEMGQFSVPCLTNKIPEETLKDMRPGSFWSLRNVRLKFSNHGSLECDFYDVVVNQVSEDHDDIRLKELLKRREKFRVVQSKWLEERRVPGQMATIEQLRMHDCCDIIAELIYRVNDFEDVTDLYVTDYTANSIRSFYKPSATSTIDGRPVFCIGVRGERGITHGLEYGDVFVFKAVKVEEKMNYLKGRLTQAASNIIKVSSATRNEEMVTAKKEVLNRKEAFYGKRSDGGEAASRIASSVVHHRHDDQKCFNTIQEILEHEICPHKYRLKARIADFHPHRVEDFTLRRCKSCKLDIARNASSCSRCPDSTNEMYYRFFLQIEDMKGDRLMTAVSDEGDIFLGGLRATDLRKDTSALEKMASRLSRTWGNLIEYHEGVADKVERGPILDLCVKSWPVRLGVKESRAYGITGCDIVVNESL